MAIDPMLYQKLSGRSGDPTDAYGKALAQDAKRTSEWNSAAYYDEVPSPVASYFKWKWIIGSVVSLAVLGALFWGFFFRGGH